MEKTYAETFNANRVRWFYEIARSDVSPAAVKVGLLFATFVNAESREEVSPSYAWVCATAKLSRPTVGRCVDELVRAGFLDVVKYPGHRLCFALPFSGEGDWSKPVPNVASEIEGV